MKFNNKYLAFIFSIIFFTGNIRGQVDSKNFDKRIPLDSMVRYGKLENGFTYYLRKNDKPKNIIKLYMVVKAGMYHEDEDQLEYSHLLEHLGAKGTKHFPSVNDYFRTSGRYSHASTGWDFTKYNVRIPSGDKQVLQAGLQLVRDWAQGIRLEQESIDVERGAVLGEMRNSNPHRRWLSDIIAEEILEGTGYKLYDLVKHKASIENFNREAFLRYYKDWYRPDLEAAIIVGDINLDSMEMKVKHMFSDLKMPGHPRNRQEKINAQTIELSGKNRYSTVLDTMHPDFRLYMISKRLHREYSVKTRADYREMLLQQLYTKMVAPRGRQLQQQYNPPFSNFDLSYRSNFIGGGQIHATRMTVKFESDDPRHIKKSLVDALIAWKRMHIGFTRLELEDAKDQLLQNYTDKEAVNSSDIASRYVDHFVSDIAAPNPKVEARLVSGILSEIDLKEIQDFISEYSDLRHNTDFLFFKGIEDSVPDFKMVKQWVAVANAMKVEPMDPPKPPIQSLASAAQIPVKQDVKPEEVWENSLGVTTVVLKNGVKILLKPTKPANERYEQTVTIHAYRPNRVPIENREKYLAANIVPEVIRYTGAGPYTKFELDKYMRDKGIRLRFETDKDYQMINGKSNVADMEEWLNLLYLYITQPAKDSNGFTAWKASQVEKLNGTGIRGSSEFYMEKIRARWFPEVPRIKKQNLDQLKMRKVFRAFKHWYSNIDNYTFIITGDFETDSLMPILVNNLSAFPVGERSSPDGIVEYEFPLKKMDETIRLKNISQAYVRLYFPVTVPKDISTKVELRLLSKALHNRIWDRLRAGCYAPDARGVWLDIQNGIFAFLIVFDSGLGNEARLKQWALEEFRKLREEGVDEEWLKKEIEDEKVAYGKKLDRYRFWFLNFWQDYIKEKLENEEDLESEVLQYKTVLEHFTSVEDVNKTAKLYLTQENLQQFLVIPEGYHQP